MQLIDSILFSRRKVEHAGDMTLCGKHHRLLHKMVCFVMFLTPRQDAQCPICAGDKNLSNSSCLWEMVCRDLIVET